MYNVTERTYGNMLLEEYQIVSKTDESCVSWDTEVIGQFHVFKDDPALLQAIVWCCGTIGIIVVCMNFIVILSILKAPDLRQNSVYIFMLSLAVADFLAAVVFVSIFLKFHLERRDFINEGQNTTSTDPHHLFHANDKKLKEYLIKLMLVTACLTASIGSLALTAIDRFIAVLKPFEYKVIATKKRCILSVVVMWLTSIAISSLPVTTGWRCSFGCYGFPRSGCSQIYPGISQSYLTFYVTVASTMLLLVVLMYLYIFVIVWRHLQTYCNFESEARAIQKQNANGARDETRRSIKLPRKSSISSLYELEMVDKPACSSRSQSTRQYYELSKENFRFVLVVDENLPAPAEVSRKELQTCFRGYIFYGDKPNRRRKKSVFSNISPAITRKRANRRLTQARNRDQMQIVQTLILILGVLLVCWTPSLIFMILDLTSEIDQRMKKAFAFFAVLTLLNSAINPVIYAIRLKELRTIAKKSMCCLRTRT